MNRRLNDQTVDNILLKVNMKLNGVNQIINKDMKPSCMRQPVMIMGADVTHPAPDAQNTPSYAAVTASHDPQATQYNICWRLQGPREEMIYDMKDITREQLLYFNKKNNLKPLHIIYIRDGVSNGQFEDVRRIELQAIRDACTSLQPDYKPAITVIIVQKRHHTRLFPCDKRDSEDKNCNVPAGTCVDKIITNPLDQQFYLVSHASIQGVAKPTKYHTIHDDKNLSDDEVETLIYYLCHVFARCNRSVSYPAPTYYAHLAAARAKVYCELQQNIQIDALDRLQTRLAIQECIVKDLPMFFV